LVVVGWKGLVLAFLRENLVLAQCNIFVSFFDIDQLSLKSIDSLQGVVVEFIMLLHSFKNFIRLRDIGVGLDVIIGFVQAFVFFY
jgi:hypothetical protein